MVHLARALGLVTRMRDSVFHLAIYRHFSTFEKSRLPIQREGFHLKSPKTDSNFLGVGGG
jgi:hypothetical protein